MEKETTQNLLQGFYANGETEPDYSVKEANTELGVPVDQSDETQNLKNRITELEAKLLASSEKFETVNEANSKFAEDLALIVDQLAASEAEKSELIERLKEKKNSETQPHGSFKPGTFVHVLSPNSAEWQDGKITQSDKQVVIVSTARGEISLSPEAVGRLKLQNGN